MMDGSTTLAEVIANCNVVADKDAYNSDKLRGEIIFDVSEGEFYGNHAADGLTENWQLLGGGGGVTDHGALSGLGDDDHTQYYNSSRHTKAIHDSLGIVAADSSKLGGKNASEFFNKLTNELDDIANGFVYGKATHVQLTKLSGIVSENIPTADQKAALAGTGTPSASNKYVTEDYAGAVSSVFGRTGAVVAQQSDYDTWFTLYGHGHAISNVTNLQSTLDGKLNTTEIAADSYRLGTQLPEYYAAAAAYLALAGGTMTGSITFETGANIVKGGNVVLGVDSSLPYFPYGLVLGSAASAAESIQYLSGVIYFAATSGFSFDTPIAVPNSGIKFGSLTSPGGEIYNFNFLGSDTMVLKSADGIHFFLGSTAAAKITGSGFSIEGKKITGLSTETPTADSDAACKKYVDDTVAAISFGAVYDDKSPKLGGDLKTDGFQIKDTTGTLIFESYNGNFLFRKVTT
jgi:hypothetical protein